MKSFQPNDVIRYRNRVWRVAGVYLGGTVQQSLIGLVVDDDWQSGSACGKNVYEMLVPEELLQMYVGASPISWLRHV